MDAEAMVFVVEDDAPMRQALTNLMRSVGLWVEAFASASPVLPVHPEAFPGPLGRVGSTPPVVRSALYSLTPAPWRQTGAGSSHHGSPLAVVGETRVAPRSPPVTRCIAQGPARQRGRRRHQWVDTGHRPKAAERASRHPKTYRSTDVSKKNSRGLVTSTNIERSDNSRANRALPKRVANWAWTSFQMGSTWARLLRLRSVRRTSRAPVLPSVDPGESLLLEESQVSGQRGTIRHRHIGQVGGRMERATTILGAANRGMPPLTNVHLASECRHLSRCCRAVPRELAERHRGRTGFPGEFVMGHPLEQASCGGGFLRELQPHSLDYGHDDPPWSW
jgi:hypothetical protein